VGAAFFGRVEGGGRRGRVDGAGVGSGGAGGSGHVVSAGPRRYPGPFSQASSLNVSCPTGNECLAVDQHGYLLASANPASGSWTRQDIDPGGELRGVSCPSLQLCVAVDGLSNDALVSTDPVGGQWTSTQISDGTLDSISCPSTQLCVAIDGDGSIDDGFVPTALVSTNPAGGVWTTTTLPGDHDVGSVSCPSTSLCVAAPGDGRPRPSARRDLLPAYQAVCGGRLCRARGDLEQPCGRRAQLA